MSREFFEIAAHRARERARWRAAGKNRGDAVLQLMMLDHGASFPDRFVPIVDPAAINDVTVRLEDERFGNVRGPEPPRERKLVVEEQRELNGVFPGKRGRFLARQVSLGDDAVELNGIRLAFRCDAIELRNVALGNRTLAAQKHEHRHPGARHVGELVRRAADIQRRTHAEEVGKRFSRNGNRSTTEEGEKLKRPVHAQR